MNATNANKNVNRLFSLILFLILSFCAACAPAAPKATPAVIAVEPQKASEKAQEWHAPEATATSGRIAVEPTSVAAATTRPESEGPEAKGPEAAYPTPPPDNQFQDAGINPETKTTYDHLSTFALDVDTASYSVTRRYINDGILPPYEAVRVEEFVNAFDQGYEAPRDSAFAVYADGAPAPRGYQAGTYLVRFGVQGYRVEKFERKPAVLTFVIDVSGSMNADNRLNLVKRSLLLLVDRLGAQDSVTIVVYGTNARTALPPTNGNRHGEILEAIDLLGSEGSTNAEAGLRLGYRHAKQTYREGANNRVILCSDGVANVGNIDADTILSEVARYAGENIYLTTIGVGMGNFNDVLLEQLADHGNGSYAYVDTIAEARKVFVDDLVSTLQVIAKNAKVQVDFNPDVIESYRLLGYENRAVADSDFRNDSVDAGELGAGHTATALYAVRIKPEAQGRIATFQLRWEDPDTGEVKELNGNFNTWGLAGSFDESSARYQLAITVGQFAEVLRESPYVRVSLGDLAARANRIARQLPEDEQVAEFADLAQNAADLRGD